MRKIAALLLTVCICCAVCTALADASPAGTWYLVRMRTGQGADVSMAGSETQIIIDLKEDGAALLTIVSNGSSQSDNCTWSADAGTVTLVDPAGASRVLTVRDSELEMPSGSGYLFFSRSMPSLDLPEIPAVRAESAEAFSGRWSMFRVLKDGMLADQGTIGADRVPSLEIGDGAMTETAFDDNGQPLQYVYICSFADGTLSASLNDGNGSVTIVFSLLEDGMLKGVINAGTPDETVIWYRPAEASAEVPAA